MRGFFGTVVTLLLAVTLISVLLIQIPFGAEDYQPITLTYAINTINENFKIDFTQTMNSWFTFESSISDVISTLESAWSQVRAFPDFSSSSSFSDVLQKIGEMFTWIWNLFKSLFTILFYVIKSLIQILLVLLVFLFDILKILGTVLKTFWYLINPVAVG